MNFYTTKEMILEKLPLYLKHNDYFLTLINYNVKENDKLRMGKGKNGYFFMSKDLQAKVPFSILISNKGTVQLETETQEKSKLKDGRVAPLDCNTKVFVTKNKNNNTFTISQRMTLTACFVEIETKKDEKRQLNLTYIEPKYAKLQKLDKRLYNSDHSLRSITANVYKMEMTKEEKEKWDENIPIVEQSYYYFLDRENALLKYTRLDSNTKEEKTDYYLTMFNVVEKENVKARRKITKEAYDTLYQERLEEIKKQNQKIENKIKVKKK